jgi:ribosomal protein S18 acetylase RimI-like enzyme
MVFEYYVKTPGTEVVEEIHDFLVATDSLSIPPLSHRMNLLDFAHKLQEKATLFEYRIEGKIVALNAVYVNEYPIDSYATSLAVLPKYEGFGLGAKLILKAIKYCKEFGSEGYRLQMRSSNSIMLDFYLRMGFDIIAEEDYPENVKGVILKLNYK